MTAHRVVVLAAIVTGLFMVVVGVWILFGPHSFYDQLAVFRPYNRHFLHDAGAFQVGLGVAVLLALRWSDALVVTLGAVAVGSWLHVASHVVDRHIGGRPATDIPGLAALAALATIGAIARIRETGGGRPRSPVGDRAA
jgi:hypothetical protein